MRLDLFLIAAFCRLAKTLSHSQQTGWLVGAVGIEKNPIAIKSCKTWCCSHSYRDNHYKHYKIEADINMAVAIWQGPLAMRISHFPERDFGPVS